MKRGIALLFVLSLFLFVASGSMWAADPSTTEMVVAAPAKVEPSSTFLSRHFKFLAAESDFRYRYLDKAASKVTDRDFQHKVLTRLQVNLDGEGATYVTIRGESGRNFSSSWDYNGKGLNRGYWAFNVKSFYLGHKFGHGVEAQVGGIEFDRGAGTEATYADSDGWLEGYRLTYDSKKLRYAPSHLGISVGYVGDFLEPNFFERAHRMGEVNYVQAIAAKDLTKKLTASVEFDSIGGLKYAREAVKASKLRFVVVDEVTVESIARVTGHGRFGWSGTISKGLDKKGKLRLGMFYSDIPPLMFVNGKTVVLLNGDMFGLGKRIGPAARYTPVKSLEFSVMGSSRRDNTPGCRYRGQAAVRFQFMELLNQAMLR